jgi:hypothetical protein
VRATSFSAWPKASQKPLELLLGRVLVVHLEPDDGDADHAVALEHVRSP